LCPQNYIFAAYYPKKIFMHRQIIKNIIFDFGGVIIDIDFWKSINAFINLGFENFDQIYSQSGQTELFDELDKGFISPDEFRNKLQELFPSGVSTKMIDDAWNAILIGIPAHRIHLLEKIRNNYRIFLMSNTNTIHYTEYIKELKEKYGYDNLSCLFEKVYLSFELGLRKPDEIFFKLILDENNLIPSETLFIDDSEQNLPPAKSFGINTLFLTNGMDVTELFENWLLKTAK
jgi:glucose-1-phosphatase